MCNTAGLDESSISSNAKKTNPTRPTTQSSSGVGEVSQSDPSEQTAVAMIPISEETAEAEASDPSPSPIRSRSRSYNTNKNISRSNSSSSSSGQSMSDTLLLDDLLDSMLAAYPVNAYGEL